MLDAKAQFESTFFSNYNCNRKKIHHYISSASKSPSIPHHVHLGSCTASPPLNQAELYFH